MVKSENEVESAKRASVSFPPGLYQELEGIAKENKVSLAWVVREAAEQYVARGGESPRSSKAKKK